MSLLDQWFKNQKLEQKRGLFIQHRMETMIQDSSLSKDSRTDLLKHLAMISSDEDCAKRVWPILNFVLNTLESRESDET